MRSRVCYCAFVAGWILAAQPPVSPARAGQPLVAGATQQQASSFSRELRTKRWLRARLVGPEELEDYGLLVHTPLRDHAEKPLVVLVHGFNSTAEGTAVLIKPIRRAGFTVGTFAYPNDHEIAASARLLSSQLRYLAQVHPQRRIALVAHSMGSLVARECVENSDLDPGNVCQLIMIAPPTRGTMLAHFAKGTDLWEHCVLRQEGGCWTRIKASLADGLGEAIKDLRPGSAFLKQLNRRPRHTDVRYTILLGSGAKAAERDVDRIRGVVRGSIGKIPGLGSKARRADRFLEDLEEIVRGKGDGIVAIRRGTLVGVSDTVILPFRHLSVLGPPRGTTTKRVHATVLDRLKRHAAQPQ